MSYIKILGRNYFLIPIVAGRQGGGREIMSATVKQKPELGNAT
jgi:hypothetical protein